MKLTLKQVQASYDFLRSMPPFCKWRPPESQSFILRVIDSDRVFGEYESDPHQISVSKVHCDHFMHVLETVAHEMCHMAAERKGQANHSEHGSAFTDRAKEVCSLWGWNMEGF